MDWFGIGRDAGRRLRDGEGARRSRLPGALCQGCRGRARRECTVDCGCCVRARDVWGLVEPRGVAVLEDGASRSERHMRAMCAWVASVSACRWAACASSASYSASSSTVSTQRIGTAMPSLSSGFASADAAPCGFGRGEADEEEVGPVVCEDAESLACARHEHRWCVKPPDRVTSAVGGVVTASAHDGGRIDVNVLEFQGAAAREHDVGVGAAKALLEWGVAEQRRHVVAPLGESSAGAEPRRRIGDRAR